jgi:hypothetical protein
VIDKSSRKDGTFSRDNFAFDPKRDRYACPAGKELVQYRRVYSPPRNGVSADGMRFTAPKNWIATPCELIPLCCPNAEPRKVHRHIHENIRGEARAA